MNQLSQRSERADDDPDKITHPVRRRHAQVAEKKEYGAEYAFFCMLSRKNIVRKSCIQLASHRYFEIFIIGAIVTNSVILGLSDFTVVDSALNPASTGLRYANGVMVSAHSNRNRLLELSEIPFTIIFVTECIIKIVSMGFVSGKGSYLRDYWNMLDFVVVISSVVASLPGMPNVSAIRTIRVLRPLRSLSVIPGMRRLITALLKALPALGNVLILQIFVFFIFGILGIQLFGGGMNRRCRLTEFPVKLPPGSAGSNVVWPIPEDYLRQVLANPDDFKCLDGPLLEYTDGNIGEYTKETSPWSKPRDCFWPVDETDIFICAAEGQSGNHQCSSSTTCGSSYDYFGNKRFKYHKAVDSLYTGNLNWGYTNFDNIGTAFFTIFQTITQEGWTLIMYMVMDSSEPLVGALFFIILIIFASFFVMNLLLAVISDEFQIEDDGSAQIAAEKKELALQAERARLSMKPRLPWLFKVVSHPYFSNFIMFAILANTVVLALDHHPMPAQLDSDLEIINFGLSCIFVVEMVLKLFGLGIRQYSRDRFNVFDAFIVTSGLLELITSPPSFLSENPPKKGAVSALRTLRLFRIFKLARNWKDFRELLAVIGGAVASIGNFAVLMFLFIYIYALVGLQFFANTMRFDSDGYPMPTNDVSFWTGEVPRTNFDTLLWSVVTVFQVITGENWNNIMYDTIRGNGMVACVYFISLVIFGSFILMNLFLALLLDNFSGDDDEERMREKEESAKELAKKVSGSKVAPTPKKDQKQTNRSFRGSGNGAGQHLDAKPILKIDAEDDEEEEDVHNLELDQVYNELAASVWPKIKNKSVSSTNAPELKQSKSTMRIQSQSSTQFGNKKSTSAESKQNEPSKDKGDSAQDGTSSLLPPKGKFLFIFSEETWIRKATYRLTEDPLFDKIILGLIILSSVSLAVDNPLHDPDSPLSRFLKRMDNAFAIIFCAEMVFKIIALGLISHEESYLRNSWNILDCGIVISSLVMLIAESSGGGKGLKSLRSLRGLRTFRPLRMISRRPGLKLVVNALIESIPKVANVLLVCMLFFFIFSIMAVNYLKGTFYSCQGDVFDALSSDQQDFLTTPVVWTNMTEDQQDWFANTTCLGFASSSAAKITSRYICECWRADWSPVMAENFNNVAQAMLAFYEISTTEGWSDMMMAAVDATEVDMQPIRDNNEIWTYFFLTFIMVCHFFAVNLFVGVIIDNFNKMKIALGDSAVLTPEQRKWVEAQKAALRVGPIRIIKPPKHPTRRIFFDLVKSPKFEWLIIVCIIINTLLMATQYFGEATVQFAAVAIVNEIFAVIFTMEAVMKLIAYGWEYFDDSWNRFDFFVVCGTLASILIETITGASVRSIAMLVRVFRVTRIIRLVRASKSIRQILLTLYIALPGLSNVASILFLMIFIYATMGVQMFAKVAFSDNIDAHANFQDFLTAVLFLLRAATGEAWDYCMHDLAAQTDGCVDDPPYNPDMCGFKNFEDCIPLNGCGNWISYAYFCSFTLLVTYVMLNLTIAVILEGFSASHEDEEPLFEPELLEEFQYKWVDIDKRAKGLVRVTKLMTLVSILEQPLGRYGVCMTKSEFLRFMCDLDLPMYEGETVHFKDVLLSLARDMVKENIGSDKDMSKFAPPMDDDFGVDMLDFSAHEYFAVCRIQRSVVAWLRTKRELEKQYMEEYKNKIKKPSGRPKKVRDARVYTIG